MSADVTAPPRSKPIVVTTRTTAAEFEAAVDQALTVDPSPQLKLATHWDLARSPGGAPRAAQLVASWARIARDPTLIIHASGPEDVETIQRFTRQLHGLSAAMLATRVY